MRIYLGLLLLVSIAVNADSNPMSSNNLVPVNPLPIETMEVVQQIGNSVLQARQSAKQNVNQNGQAFLSEYSNILNKLIASENAILVSGQAQQSSLGSVSNQVQGTSVVTPNLIKRMAAQNQAWDYIANLREASGKLVAKTNVQPQIQVNITDSALNNQRAQLFEKWADELEGILTDNDQDRVKKLITIQSRINLQLKRLGTVSALVSSPSIQSRMWKNPALPENNN